MQYLAKNWTDSNQISQVKLQYRMLINFHNKSGVKGPKVTSLESKYQKILGQRVTNLGSKAKISQIWGQNITILGSKSQKISSLGSKCPKSGVKSSKYHKSGVKMLQVWSQIVKMSQVWNQKFKYQKVTKVCHKNVLLRIISKRLISVISSISLTKVPSLQVLLDFWVVVASSNQALGSVQCILGVGNGLSSGRSSHNPLAVRREGYHRWRRPRSFTVLQHFGTLSLHQWHARVSSAKVNANDVTFDLVWPSTADIITQRKTTNE